MKRLYTFIFVILYFCLCTVPAIPQDRGAVMPIPKIDLNIEEAQSPQEIALSLQILFLLSIITLAPSIMVLMTSFLRIIIVFDFIKKALSLQQVPPNQLMFGLALFMTLFIMWPTFEKINNDAIQPFIHQNELPTSERLSMEDFFKKLVNPIRDFMLRQTDEKYIGFFMNMRNLPAPETFDDVPTYILIPAFVINELTVGFEMGVLIFFPFLVIDMVVASTLMAMGMIMLPPVMISLPFKIILFILVDGWSLLTQGIFVSFM
ncbi:MAG: flagellar type III secretion system pore protein FliP [Spirochaetales bacterium]|nr:flagellar type III secretion system pore protein FliP [Spirochaetales bacterium]MBQ2293923.1 flagellar type III secretion system pore protein FliP [Spirochaetales bacterium]